MEADEIYKRIERMYSKDLSSTGKTERSFSQNVGKIYNKDIHGYKAFDEMLSNVERIMKGKFHPRWYHQNVKTDQEKLQEKGDELNGQQ